MSELKNAKHLSTTHWQLLASVSVATLLIAISSPQEADAADGSSSHPTVWIELGGQFSWSGNRQEAFLSPFVPATNPPFEITSPAEVEKSAPNSWDGNARIAFEPNGTDWTFSAAVVYGRSSRNRFLSQVTEEPDQGTHGVYVGYQNVTSHSNESHTIFDFYAGKDVGLGLGVNSVVNLGVRYVQFKAAHNTIIQSQPTNVGFFNPYHRINAQLVANQTFRGLGPSLSWEASAPLVGDRNNGEIALDWGFNGAVLFGRQSVHGHHQTTTAYYTQYYNKSSHHHSVALSREKQVVVPNIGGFAGASWRYPSAKVTLGYRADFFFGAMDSGIDARRAKTVGFYGPFASVSIGLGG